MIIRGSLSTDSSPAGSLRLGSVLVLSSVGGSLLAAALWTGSSLAVTSAPVTSAAEPSATASPAPPQSPDTVFLEELTWTEARDAIESGTTTLIIATAGNEQNGPHMVLGKHHFIIEHAAEQIARRLGNALVAPIVTYVPEGDVDQPRGHMSKAGTITLPNEYFVKLLEYAARSAAVHGFTDIVLIGDSGGNQRGMGEVADVLNAEWADAPARVHFVGDYYANNGFRDWLIAQGETPETIGSHAGISDTSQLMYVAPQHVRLAARAPGGGFEDSGVSGDPTRATVEYGRRGIEMKVDAAVRQIRALMAVR